MYLRSAGRSRRALVGTSLAIAGLLATASSVFAYNQLWPHPNTDSCNGYPGNYVCIRWPRVLEPPSTVVTIFLGSSLTLEEVNLKPVVRDTISHFNAQPALNPWLDEVGSDCCEDIKAKTEDLNDPGVFGFADIQNNWTTGEITHVTIVFNQEIVWKTTTGGNCYDPPGSITFECTQDARKVSNHEMGHAQGLAHEFAPTTAVMRQGFLSYHKLQTDDTNGLIAIYGAYNP